MTVQDKRRDYGSKKFQTFAASLGRLSLAWNSLHLELFDVFSAVTGYSNRMIPGTIWHALKSDRSQRDILKDLTESRALGINLSKDKRREIVWLINRVDELENIRNHLIHTPFAISGEDLFPLHLGQHKRGLSFEGRDIQAEADWVFARSSILSGYAEKIAESIRRTETSLPERPSLPNRPPPSEK